MKNKIGIVVSIVATILLGYFAAEFVYDQYKKETAVFNENNTLYYLQQGAYTTNNIANENAKKLSQYVITFEDSKYYTYIGMTTDKKLAEKIRDIYKEEKIELYIKEVSPSNKDFYNEVEQYDILLNSSKNMKEINSVLKTVIASFEEIVLNK